jgi:hypothetical protein
MRIAYSILEAAEATSLGRSTIEEAVAKGRLPARKVWRADAHPGERPAKAAREPAEPKAHGKGRGRRADTDVGAEMSDWLNKVLSDGVHSQRLRTDLPYFAEHALKLRPKTGALVLFRFNAAQRKLHEPIEAQRAKTGRVRVICLKARQLGHPTVRNGLVLTSTTRHAGRKNYQ